MICGIGGIFGILVGYLGTLIVGKMSFQTILVPSAGITVGAFLISVALGIVFGLYPAVKASGLQPVVARRAEGGTSPSFCALLPGREGSSGR